ncbi:hypothetical protein WJX72_001975 [[Myrmecia] bisecta]|uniref:Uncharacterized protein n=1 Tax=[Myrmecia] bisecta TaxID=41462 RepID=A0AAW1R4T6_9CHLO
MCKADTAVPDDSKRRAFVMANWKHVVPPSLPQWEYDETRHRPGQIKCDLRRRGYLGATGRSIQELPVRRELARLDGVADNLLRRCQAFQARYTYPAAPADKTPDTGAAAGRGGPAADQDDATHLTARSAVKLAGEQRRAEPPAEDRQPVDRSRAP